MEGRSQLLHRGCQVRVMLGDVFPPAAQRQPPRGRWVHFGAMLPTVPVPPRHLDDYRETAGPEAVERLRKVAAPLAGARVLHVNSTAFGGGVAELLFAQIPLMNDLGMEAVWQVMECAEDFVTVTMFAHSGLQGG